MAERKGSHAAFIAVMSATPIPNAIRRGRMAGRSDVADTI